MISNRNEMFVAQNCNEYESKYLISLLNASNISASCNSCENYAKGKCTKGLFDEIVDIIRRN
jgi:hypothetical protein